MHGHVRNFFLLSPLAFGLQYLLQFLSKFIELQNSGCGLSVSVAYTLVFMVLQISSVI